MLFGIVMKKEKIVKSGVRELPAGNNIKSLQEGGSYKHLGTLETDKPLVEIKVKVSKWYLRQLQKALTSKWNDRDSVQGINTWAVSISKYSAAFIS